MLEAKETTRSRDIEIQALGDRLRARAALLGVGEPDLAEMAIRCKGCGIISCTDIQSMECPPTDKNY